MHGRCRAHRRYLGRRTLDSHEGHPGKAGNEDTAADVGNELLNPYDRRLATRRDVGTRFLVLPRIALERTPILQITRRMIVLINDDGISSPGLSAAHELLGTLGDVLIVVPDRDRTATGHAMTLDRPIDARSISYAVNGGSVSKAWIVSGTPTDCAKLACTTICQPPPRFVVSGINLGENVGTGIFYSGTVAGALEAAINGIPAIAVSLCDGSALGYRAAARLVRPIVVDALAHGLPPWTILNINVPNMPEAAIRGVKLTHMGVSGWLENYQVIAELEDGTRRYQLAGTFVVREDNDDAAAVRDGWISVSPLHLTLTASSDHLQAWQSLSLVGTGKSPSR